VLTSGRPAATVVRQLAALGVTARLPVFQPLHRTLQQAALPGTTEICRHAVSVPIYPGLTKREEAAVVTAVRRVLG
jgi:dTDP-4-amino-4,6-dideoxygalactose transaminase